MSSITVRLLNAYTSNSLRCQQITSGLSKLNPTPHTEGLPLSSSFPLTILLLPSSPPYRF